jgi:dihydroorotate dehydrogenase
MYKVIRPILFLLPAEKAHNIAMFAMRYFWPVFYIGRRVNDSRLQQTVFGDWFNSPIMNAAGFDKRGIVGRALTAMGIGGYVVGTIVRFVQSGNSKPRMFRLPAKEGIKNRMGLNSLGAIDAHRNLSRFRWWHPNMPIGVSFGYNTGLGPPYILEDQAYIAAMFKDLMTFGELNDSCPNTGKSDAEKSSDFLREACQNLRAATDKPLLLKIAPNLSDDEIRQKCDIAKQSGFVGMVTCNTFPATVGDAHEPSADFPCGESGPMLFKDSLRTVKVVREHWKDAVIIGVGGINSAERAIEMLQAGANLLELYTGLVYSGPGLVKQILRGILAYMNQHGLQNVSQIRSHYLQLNN